jgi:hypothetical protein
MTVRYNKALHQTRRQGVPASRAIVEGRLAGEGRCYPGARASPCALLMAIASLLMWPQVAQATQTVPVGQFEFFDQIGVQYTLNLRADATYELEVMLEPPGTKASGRVKVVGSRLHLNPSYGSLKYLEVIKWGEQTYLVAPSDLREFCGRASAIAAQPTAVVQSAGAFSQWRDKKSKHPNALPRLCVAGAKD